MIQHLRLVIILVATYITQVHAQSNIKGGPIVGAVTDKSAKIYLRTLEPAIMKLEYGTDSSFNSFDTLLVATVSDAFNSIHIQLNGLQADSKYYYRFKDVSTGDQVGITQRFRTFPPEGLPAHIRLVVGSCNYNNNPGGGQGNPNFKNDLMFQEMVNFDPHLFLHLGDWGFTPSALGASHLAVPALAAESFDIRYRDPNMKDYILPNMAVDYIYDDDYNHNGTAGWTYPTIRPEPIPGGGGTRYILEDKFHPPGLRDSCISAYFRHFPAYPQVDTSGIHHRIVIGNVEMFVVDTRSSKSPVHEAFRFVPLLNTWSWNPGPNRTTLGDTQRQWLLDGLKNSNADWKIMANSVVFNRKMGDLMPIVIAGQLIERSLIEYATAVAYMWAGYPRDMNAVLNLIKNERVENVLVLSGDTHSSMLDDGANAGLPELSSSGLSADDEGYLNYTIDSLAQMLNAPISVKQNLWNGGGSGIDNANFSDTYGTVEFFGKDSVKMCVIDEFLQTLGCLSIRNTRAGSTPVRPQIIASEDVFQLMYPNPARDVLQVRFNQTGDAVCRILNMSGQEMSAARQVNAGDQFLNFPIGHLPEGMYILSYESQKGIATRKFIKKQ